MTQSKEWGLGALPQGKSGKTRVVSFKTSSRMTNYILGKPPGTKHSEGPNPKGTKNKLKIGD